MIERWRHSSILDVQSVMTADCNITHYLVVAKIRERLVVNEQKLCRLHMEGFNLKKLNETETVICDNFLGSSEREHKSLSDTKKSDTINSRSIIPVANL
jgi:hypothetical protein